MKVAELIDILNQYDPTCDVFIEAQTPFGEQCESRVIGTSSALFSDHKFILIIPADNLVSPEPHYEAEPCDSSEPSPH